MYRRRTFILMGWTMLLAGCDLDGTGLSYPGTSIYQAPDEGFHFHYLSPPWRTAAAEETLLLKLVVDAYGELYPGDDKVSHILRVSYGLDGTPEEAAARVRLEAMALGRQSQAAPTELISLAGDEGWQFFASQDSAGGRNYHRDCFYSDSLGRVVHFALSGAFPMDEQNVEDLVRSFAAGPDGEGGTPPPLARCSPPPGPPRPALWARLLRPERIPL